MKIPSELVEKFVAAAKDGSPVQLHSCWLDVDGSRLLATDGHMAIKVAVELTEGDVEGPVPIEVFDLGRNELKIVSKIQGKDVVPDPWVEVICGDKTVIIRNLLTNTVHSVDRPELPPSLKFPNVDKVFPEVDKGPTITFSKELLAKVLKNIDPFSVGISLWVSSSDGAVLMATEASKGAAVLMPMQSGLEAKDVNNRAIPVVTESAEVA